MSLFLVLVLLGQWLKLKLLVIDCDSHGDVINNEQF